MAGEEGRPVAPHAGGRVGGGDGLRVSVGGGGEWCGLGLWERRGYWVFQRAWAALTFLWAVAAVKGGFKDIAE